MIYIFFTFLIIVFTCGRLKGGGVYLAAVEILTFWFIWEICVVSFLSGVRFIFPFFFLGGVDWIGLELQYCHDLDRYFDIRDIYIYCHSS